MAWFQRRPDQNNELIFHNDRGSQYASDDFNKVLKEYAITSSMSGKGNCWDNAWSETLFGSLKVERLHGQRFATIRQAKDENHRLAALATAHVCTRHRAMPARLNSKSEWENALAAKTTA